MSLKSNALVFAVAVSVGLAAGAAQAFNTVPAPTNPDGTARFADPDAFADGLSESLTAGGTHDGTYLHMFGDGEAHVGFGMSRSSYPAVTSQGTLVRPYDANDPSTQR